jgi:zinc protease
MAMYPRARAAVAAVVLLLAVPYAARARVLDEAQLTERELPNGIRVLVLPEHDVPVVAVDVVLRGGSSLEGPAERGLAHVIEHMIFQRPVGTSSAGLLPYTIESLGGEILGDTTRDSIGLTATVAPDAFEVAVQALAEAVGKPLFEPDRLRAELGIMGKEFREAYSQPLTVLRDGAYEGLYGDGPYGHSPGGGPSPLPAYSVADVSAFHQRHFVGRNLGIVIVGDIDAEAALETIERHFGPLPAGESTLAPADAMPTPGARQLAVILPKGSTRMAALVWPAPGIGEGREVIVSDVLLGLLDNGTYGRLSSDLPGRLPTLRVAGASYLTQRLPGMFFVWAAADTVPTDIATSLQQTVEALLATGPTADECAASARAALLAHAQSCDTYTGQAQCIGFYEALGSGRFAFPYEDEVLKVTPDEVRALAARCLVPERALTVLGKPEEGAR